MGSPSLMMKMTRSLSSATHTSPYPSFFKSLAPFSTRSKRTKPSSTEAEQVVVPVPDTDTVTDIEPLSQPQPLHDPVVPTSSLRKPISEILNELNKRVPDSVIRTRDEDGFSLRYIPWHIVNRIMNIHAEWSGEVRNVTYSADGKTVSVVYRVTLYGSDSEIHRESTGTASVDEKGCDPVQKAEGMAFRRACARFGLGLHLYHEELS